jgi:type VI secretion system secreted protein VgrG
MSVQFAETPVRLTSHTQVNRHMAISTQLGPDKFLLARLDVEESLSRHFEIRCELLSEDFQADVQQLLQQPITIRLDTEPGSRYFHALVNEVRQLEADAHFSRYSLTAVPRLWFESLKTDCRIYQNASTDEIVKKILDENCIPHRWVLHRKYQKRTYCVQYRESNLNFLQRLLEEEGIYFYFEHDADGHTMVLADQSISASKRPGSETLQFHAGREKTQNAKVVFEVERQCKAIFRKVTLSDFNFIKPGAFRHSGGQFRQPPNEMYDYPGLFESQDEAECKERLQTEEYETALDDLTAKTTIRDLTIGSVAALRGHFTHALNRDYFVTSIHHTAIDDSYGLCDPALEGPAYQNAIRALPRETPYRPSRQTRRPIVNGNQTAIVVGPPGREIYTDPYGRIKVRFHWDRWAKPDSSSSCWIRVSQPWAGDRWGAISIPRVGQEVLVDFLDGNPDRPIVTGRVFNAANMPPYDLPAGCNVMGVRSRTVNGAGYNEFALDDTAGAEVVRIHAQHDMLRTVLNDDATMIGNNQSVAVGANQQVEIVSNQKVSVGENILIDAGTSITFQCGASRIHMNQAGVISITGMLINIAGAINTNVTAPLTTISGLGLLTAGVVSLHTGVSLNAAGAVTNIQGGQVNING